MGGDLTPGIDLVILLESPDGLINHLRIVFGITREADAPRIVEQSGASCRLSVLWNEVEVVDSVLLPFKSGPSLASFLGQLVGGLSHLVEGSTNNISGPEGQDEPLGKRKSLDFSLDPNKLRQ
jgi:hypothetical protein